MKNKLEKAYTVSCRACDNTCKISYSGIVDLFMDLATEHASYINLGMNKLAEKNCFWVVSKTRVLIKRRPYMLEKLTASTWPQKPGAIRYNRYYGISDKDGYIVEGKSEWTILDKTTGKPRRSSEVYPQDLVHLEDTLCDEPFRRLSTDFSEATVLREYKICSTDIDISQHMNNVAYIRAILGSLTCQQIEDMNIRELEIAYRVQCYEGETVSIRRMDTEVGTDLAVVKEDGTTATVMSIIFG